MIQNSALQYPGEASYTSNGKQMLKLKLAGISGDCLDEKGRDSEQQSYSSICAAHTERDTRTNTQPIQLDLYIRTDN